MASTYTVKRGDSLWKICTTPSLASSISGSNTNAKINTLVKLNSIKNKNLIYVGQVLKLSGSASSGTASSNSNKPTINALALQAGDTTGRAMYAAWTWTRDNTKGYKYRWSQYVNKVWTASDGTIDIPEDTPKDKRGEYCYATFTANKEATKVRFQVIAVSATYKKGDKEIEYWTNAEWATKEYDFSSNPPLEPGTPKVELDELNDRKLIISLDNIVAADLDAKYVRFNIVKNNTSSIYNGADDITINTKTNYAALEYVVDYGAEYKARACAVAANGKVSTWSDFSANVGTRPVAPKGTPTAEAIKLSDNTTYAVRLEWKAVSNAAKYVIEYTTLREEFESGNPSSVETSDASTSFNVILGDETAAGKEYFFRVRASNSKGESDPTPIVSLKIGEPPAAPTTWSSAKSAFVGESMELGWTHNSRDGSTQTYAQLGLKINNGEWKTYVFENKTTIHSGEQTSVENFTYGQAVSYKGELHVKMDTTHADLGDAKVEWKVQTAGITGEFSNSDWSVERTIHIYEKPTLALSLTTDLAGTNPLGDVEIPAEEEGADPYVIRKALTSFPFYIRADVGLESYDVQRPIGYSLKIIAEDAYETVDDAGRTKSINPGDAVYSKYFTVADLANPELIVEMSADNIDLESLVRYTVKCDVDMSTGLAVSGSDEFNVIWEDVEYTIGANVIVDSQAYTASIIPYCEDAEGNPVENVTISVYRREYNGALIEIATGIPNNGTAVSDPHPALDYARYRLIAKDTQTGAISFYDMAGEKVGCSSLVIQWDEEWAPFDAAENSSVEAPMWAGSMLVLPYNVTVSDNRSREVSLVSYVGREYPVSYHGTRIGETSQWSTAIPKDDVETIYALRRLSLWSGNSYVREPSGMGFWAHVAVKFNINHDGLTIPINFDITRVEGGA